MITLLLSISFLASLISWICTLIAERGRRRAMQLVRELNDENSGLNFVNRGLKEVCHYAMHKARMERSQRRIAESALYLANAKLSEATAK